MQCFFHFTLKDSLWLSVLALKGSERGGGDPCYQVQVWLGLYHHQEGLSNSTFLNFNVVTDQ